MDSKRLVLVVEDDIGIRNYIATILSTNGYSVLSASTGAEAMMIAMSHCPDLMILDLGLPDVDGTDIIRKTREWTNLPIIVVSARSHEQDKVSALDLGADDYITKPFSNAELMARVRTAIRHSNTGRLLDNSMPSGKFKAGDLVVDYEKRHVYISGNDVHLTQNEYKIVALLSEYAGRVLTYDHIIKTVWGPNSGSDNQILRVNMANIRRKIESNPADPKYIFTETGVGYRMIDSD